MERKKFISLLLSFVMLFSVITGTGITAHAAGWAASSIYIELNNEYTFYCTSENKAYSTLGSDGYYIGMYFDMPETGAITINTQSDYKYACPNIYIYESSNLDEYLKKVGGSAEYSSAYAIYKSSASISLSKGRYYLLCDIYDCSNDIKYGKKDGSFKLSVNYDEPVPYTVPVQTVNTEPCKPKKPTIKAPSTNKKHKITAKWSKVSGCDGYQVQFSTKSNFKKNLTKKTVSSQKKTSCAVKLKKGKKYYIRVRAYKTVNGERYYSSWSKTKSVKCK